MAIKPSHSSDVRALIASLGSSASGTVDFDIAVARLTLIGVRAVDRLLAEYPKAARQTRIGILCALEGIGDPRVLPVARAGLQEGAEVAIAAAGALKALLDSPDDRAAAGALDTLIGVSLDASRERRVRVAAFEALRGMPGTVRASVAAALQRAGEVPPPDDPIRAAADALWGDAVEGKLGNDPMLFREALNERAATAPLSTLRRMIESVRAREAEPQADRTGWLTVRGALHQALALRGSRVALYDLRETLAQATTSLPTNFATAMNAIGDESCLESIATAWSSADPSRDATWRQQLRAAFAAILKRERTSKRSAMMKRIRKRWPEFET
jgi:hypothetical protein